MDAIPAPIHALLDLFSTTLAEVRFGDIDGQALERLVAEVQSAADVVAAAQAALDQAREAHQDRHDVLLQQAQRAVAYARVFAENDEALTERLTAIALPRARRARATGDALVVSPDPEPAPRPRGRPRKAATSESALDGLAPRSGDPSSVAAGATPLR